MDNPTDIAFAPSVRAAQAQRGSADAYADMRMNEAITPDLEAFLAARDSAYLASASADGRPYIQHRGGPAGFIRVLGPTTLGFADFAGNRQYVTVGHLAENPKAFLFLMDYENRRRVKIWGEARAVEGDAALMARLVPPGYRARPERAILFEVQAWDVNCPQHIPRMLHASVVAAALAESTARIAALEAELAQLRGGATGGSA